MRSFLLYTLLCLCSICLSAQEKWGSYDGSIAGTHFTTVQACGDFVEVSTGNWFERMHIEALGYTNEGAGRQVRGDSVFFKHSLLDNSAPILLYDYSVVTGDTVNGLWGAYIVTEVDTEFAVGKERKRITMVSTYDGHTDIWLSELGSKVSGYLQPGSPLFVPDAGSEFSCYLDENSGEYYYGDKDPSSCMLVSTLSACTTTSLTEKELRENINVYPNPSTGFLFIEIKRKSSAKNRVRLYSLDGLVIVDRNMDRDHLSLDVSGIIPGMYLLEITQNGDRSTSKVFIN